MLKKMKFVLSFILPLVWITLSSISFANISSIGSLLTYGSGILSLQLPSNEEVIIDTQNKYQSKILIDEYGVPHIYGQRKVDLAYSLGYMQARDRYFQMEMIVRTTKGELSSVFGTSTLKMDVWWRPHDFNQKAKEIMADLQQNNPKVYNYISAFGEGVNMYLTQEMKKERSPEYNIFNITPMTWEAHYSLLVIWYLSSTLTYEDYHHLRQDQINKLPKELREALFPIGEPNAPLIIPKSSIVEQESTNPPTLSTNINWPVDSLLEEMRKRISIGSNNWVVHPDKIKERQPILCNDPHLFLTLPGPFYEVHLVTPERNMYGFALASTPLLIIGNNDDIAWGITNAEWDMTESILLKMNPKDSMQYQVNGTWKDIETSTYEIPVRGGRPYTFEYQTTTFGKLRISRDRVRYGQKWFPAEKSTSVVAFYNLLDANNWETFNSALEDFDYPPQNFAYQDRSGNIGMLCAGKMPLKPKGYQGGVLQYDSFPQYKYIPFESLPRILNPSEGYLFSANQEPIRDGNYYNYRWSRNIYRAKRLQHTLSAKSQFSLAEIGDLQKDITDHSVIELQELLTLFLGEHPQQQIANQLIHWDGKINSDSHEALVFTYFKMMWDKELKSIVKDQFNLRQPPSFASLIRYFKRTKLENITAFIDPELFLEKVFELTEEELKKDYGEKYLQAKYQVKSQFEIPHISMIPGMSTSVRTSGGNENTLNINNWAHAAIRYNISFGHDKIPHLKVIMAGGQSGRINSPQYKNQLDKWSSNNYRIPQQATSPEELNKIKHKIIFQ